MRLRLLLVLLVATLAAGSRFTTRRPVGGPEACRGRDDLERTIYLMGTLLQIRLSGVGDACGGRALNAAFAEADRLERMLSSWRADSEVGQVNHGPAGAGVRVSPQLRALLEEAGIWVAATDGAFDPAVGALIDAWALRGAGRIPSPAARRAAQRVTGWHHLSFAGDAVIRGPAGWWLDTGAFGKGAALRAAADVLRAHGVTRATLDFGGQILVLGSEAITVAHPTRRQEPVATLQLSAASASTTSGSEQFVDVAGTRLSHVIDPRRGVPLPAWGSVTIVTADAFAADALSTALYVMGPDGALAWARDRRDVAVLILTVEHGVLHWRGNAALNDVLITAPVGEPPTERGSFLGSTANNNGMHR
jgi:FAD:protein FMN transferase